MTDIITSAGPQASTPRPLHTRSLSQDLAGLLWTNSDLPQPSSVTVYGDHDHITLHFVSDPSSYAAVAKWAARYGGTVENRPCTHEGHPSVICRTEWTTYGVEVTAFALIRTSTEAGTDA
jgi:hypothetical protein